MEKKIVDLKKENLELSNQKEKKIIRTKEYKPQIED
jgi:hypothetical protein